jgi:hypothetical protein
VITAIIYDGLTAVLLIFVVYQWRASTESAKAAKKSADVAAMSLAISQRGHLQFAPGLIAYGQGVSLRYAFVVEGPTGVVIRDGHINISIDDPPLEPGLRERLVVPIGNQSVSPRSAIQHEANFPVPSTPERVAAWHSGDMEIFVGGEIRYRDAFPETPIHHKFFGYKWTARSRWQLNQFVRNDEEDESRD